MALQATIYKAELQVSDMDRHYYATHALTLARHPSETEQRLMVRLLAFGLFAHDQLEFGKGLSSDDEPDLWRKDYGGQIEQWIELGQPDEARIRKACGRAQQVVVINYGGRAADIWWNKNANALARHRNLTVLDLPADAVTSLGEMIERSLRLQCLIQDGHIHLMGATADLEVMPRKRMGAD